MTQNSINNSASDLTVDNLFLDGNTISTLDTNGNLILSPNGTGAVTIDNISLTATTISSTSGDLVIESDATNDIQFYNGTSTTLNMTSSGEMNLPLQPAFLAFNSANDTNQTGAGATVTVDFDTEVFDQGGDFSADTFTAPITGNYNLSSWVRSDNLSSAMTLGNLSIITSNRTYRYNMNPYNQSDSGSLASFTVSALADMDALDTAIVQLTISSGAGNTATISGNASLMVTFFCGQLLS